MRGRPLVEVHNNTTRPSEHAAAGSRSAASAGLLERPNDPDALLEDEHMSFVCRLPSATVAAAVVAWKVVDDDQANSVGTVGSWRDPADSWRWTTSTRVTNMHRACRDQPHGIPGRIFNSGPNGQTHITGPTSNHTTCTYPAGGRDECDTQAVALGLQPSIVTCQYVRP
jgi:hypothetical protein